MSDDAHRKIKTRHYNAMWRVLKERRPFVYSASQAFWLRRMIGEGFVRFFQILATPKVVDTSNPKSPVSQVATDCGSDCDMPYDKDHPRPCDGGLFCSCDWP